MADEETPLHRRPWREQVDQARQNVADAMYRRRLLDDGDRRAWEAALLVEPNLTGWGAATGRRQCLACERARTTVRDALRRGQQVDLDEAAAAHYAQIMGEAA